MQWREVNVPEVIFAEDTVSIPVHWRALGMKQGTVEIVLSMNGKEVGRREVQAADGEDLRQTITFVPDTKLFEASRPVMARARTLRRPFASRGAMFTAMKSNGRFG